MIQGRPVCVLFLEDGGHASFVSALVVRVADEIGVDISVAQLNSSGGAGRAVTALSRYMSDLGKGTVRCPDVLVAAVDADREMYQSRRADLQAVVSGCPLPPERLVFAVPDPHVEAWYLCDGVTVASVAGDGAEQVMLPDGTQQKSFYKQKLEQVFESAGVKPPLGGSEYGDEIARELNLALACQRSPSLGDFVTELRAAMKQLLIARSDL